MIPAISGTLLMLYAGFGFLLFVSVPLRRALHDAAVVLDAVFLPMAHLSTAWCIAMGILGFNLFRRRKGAWVVAVAGLGLLNLGNVLVYVLSPETFEEPPAAGHLLHIGTMVQACLLIVVVFSQSAFPTLTRRMNFRLAGLTWIIGTILVSLLAVLLVFQYPGSLEGAQRIGWAVNHAAFLSLVDRSFFDGYAPRMVGITISFAAAIVLLVSVWVALRSQRSQNSLSATDEDIVRSMIKRFNGRDSLAYFATRRDKSIVYASNGRAAVTYRVQAGCAVASADPLGDEDSWEAAIEAFLHKAKSYGWVPAVMGASEDGARAYAKQGLTAVHLGDEAILYAHECDLNSSEFKAVRQSVAHAEREGVQVRVRRHAEISEEEMQQVQARAELWRDTSDERGFSMALSRLGDPADDECVLVEAFVEREDRLEVVAELSFVPWGDDGLSLDLMRRGPHAPGGTVEAMVVHLCSNSHVPVRRVSLNFAVFRSIFASESDIAVSPVRSAMRRTLVFLSRWWQMEALYRSNAKYNPRWVPRYMCFGSSATLPHAALAAGIAEGFIPWFGSEDIRTHATEETPGADVALAAKKRWESRKVPKLTAIEKQLLKRIESVEDLQAQGVDPWALSPSATMTCTEVLQAESGLEGTVSGRVVAKRKAGPIVFLDIADATGVCQVLCDTTNPDVADEESAHALSPKQVEASDWVSVSGMTGVSKKGKPSLLGTTVYLQAKALESLGQDSGQSSKNKKTNKVAKVRSYIRSPHASRIFAQNLMTTESMREDIVSVASRLTDIRSAFGRAGFLELEVPGESSVGLHVVAAAAGGMTKSFAVDSATRTLYAVRPATTVQPAQAQYPEEPAVFGNNLEELFGGLHLDGEQTARGDEASLPEGAEALHSVLVDKWTIYREGIAVASGGRVDTTPYSYLEDTDKHRSEGFHSCAEAENVNQLLPLGIPALELLCINYAATHRAAR